MSFHQFFIASGNAANPAHGRELVIPVPILFAIYWCLFFHIPVPWYFITQQIHRISHKYSMTWENAANCILWGEPGKLVAIFFPKLWMLPWYPKYVSSHGKNVVKICSKTHFTGRVWKIHIHTVHKVWMSLFRQILILWDASPHWKCMGFSIILWYFEKNALKQIL